mmetsp:Transcript_11917/g.17975  ORF Transcript_11917/g.17975 Transcript_11917/m.17975 type:complete len:213 (-) Transcript_11917:257-895(-)
MFAHCCIIFIIVVICRCTSCFNRMIACHDDPLDLLHLCKCITVTMFHFKCIPLTPKKWMLAGLTILRSMNINSPSTVDFSEFGFKTSVFHANIRHIVFVKRVNRTIENISSFGDTKQFGGTRNENIKHQITILTFEQATSTVIDGHGMTRQTTSLFIVGINQMKDTKYTRGCLLFNSLFNGLLKEISDTLGFLRLVLITCQEPLDIHDMNGL